MAEETKYIVKTYEYNGDFYGYAAKNPKEDNMPYYDKDKVNAIRFKSYSDADDWIEEYYYFNELEFVIVEDFPDEMGLEEFITKWVRDNYGDNEADNPSWNIEALADAITNFINK